MDPQSHRVGGGGRIAGISELGAVLASTHGAGRALARPRTGNWTGGAFASPPTGKASQRFHASLTRLGLFRSVNRPLSHEPKGRVSSRGARFELSGSTLRCHPPPTLRFSNTCARVSRPPRPEASVELRARPHGHHDSLRVRRGSRPRWARRRVRAGRDAFARNAPGVHAVILESRWRPTEVTSGSGGVRCRTCPSPRSGRTAVSRGTSARAWAAADPKDAWWQKDAPPNVKDCDSMDAFLGELRNAGDNLVVVDFYARWCGACRALYPKLCKLAAENPDCVFLKVEFDDNKDMCRSMGVKVLPFFHMYRGKDGKVASFSASVSKVHRLRDALAEHGANAGRVRAARAGRRAKRESPRRRGDVARRIFLHQPVSFFFRVRSSPRARARGLVAYVRFVRGDTTPRLLSA